MAGSLLVLIVYWISITFTVVRTKVKVLSLRFPPVYDCLSHDFSAMLSDQLVFSETKKAVQVTSQPAGCSCQQASWRNPEGCSLNLLVLSHFWAGAIVYFQTSYPF